MDTRYLDLRLAKRTELVWQELCEIHYKLARFNPPKIIINKRIYRTAGRCYQLENRVELGYQFFNYSSSYYDIMMLEILPHELIHQADYNLWGDSDKPCGHGKNWQMLMIQFGLNPNKYHTMRINK